MRLGLELRRHGHEVAIFSRAPAIRNPAALDLPVTGVAGRALTIAAGIAERIIAEGYSDAIIEYTAQMWGPLRFGSAAVPLLAARLRQAGLSVSLAIHEPYTPWYRRPDLLVGAALLRLQFGAVLPFCDRYFVSTETRMNIVAGAAAAFSPARPLSLMRIGPNALPVARSPARAQRIGLFSTLAVGKRFDVAISALEKILPHHPNAELLLIGDVGTGGERAEAELKARIEASPAGARVRLTGKLSLQEIAATVATLDLYLFTMNTGANTRSSTLPLALGSGVPAVAIRGPETDAIFVHGDNVFFADSLDGDAFARAAIKVFSDHELAARLSLGGQRLYREHLAWDRIVDRALEVIQAP
jgi:glycosyltransferase involved in cell wall biosynthesis